MDQNQNKNQKQKIYKFEQINQQQILPKHHLSNQIIFNHNSSILFSINKTYISAYFFKLGNLKFITYFLAQKRMQKKLYYMEKSKQLVLYTVFGSIQVASIVGLNNNKQIFKLKTLVFTDSLTINKDESITIIGSQGQITFWHNLNQWKSFQTLICHNMAPIYSLSLNPSDTLLISCSYDSTINVIRKSDQQWVIIQIIQVEVHGLSLCFINDDYFVFQPIDLKVQVYQYQRYEDNFVKVKEIAIQGIEYHLDNSFFQYNAAKDILIKSNAQFLNLISGFENVEQLTKSSLFFLGNRISSTFSNNGDYLIVINNFEKKFIIYMLKES